MGENQNPPVLFNLCKNQGEGWIPKAEDVFSVFLISCGMRDFLGFMRGGGREDFGADNIHTFRRCAHLGALARKMLRIFLILRHATPPARSGFNLSFQF
jgi:hypothetical protein